MSVVEFGHFVLTIAILLVAVHGLGYLAERLKQPRIEEKSWPASCSDHLY